MTHTVGVVLAALASGGPAGHEITWPGLEQPLLSRHYSARVSLAPRRFDFPWSGETPGVTSHYWYVESERDPLDDPIIVWIQGGPGGSSIGGGFLEMGPISLDSRSLATATYNQTGIPSPVRNPFSWTTFAGLLMVDYADIGFSTCHSSGCRWDDAKTCNALADFLEVFFTDLFPERAGRPLWVAGESYAGILVTVLGAVLDHGRASSAVSFAGVLHGNGAVGHFTGGLEQEAWPAGFNTNDMPQDHRHHIDFFFRAGLVSEKLHAKATSACEADWWRPSKACTKAMYEMDAAMGDFTTRGTYWNVYDIYDTCSDMPHLSGNRTQRRRLGAGVEALLSPSRRAEHSTLWYCGGKAAATAFLNHPKVREAMHIPAKLGKQWAPEQDLDWECSQDDEYAFRHNYTTCKIQDFRPMIKALAAKSPFLVYSGDVDAQLPHTATERWTSELGFEVVEDWQPWIVREEYVGGYVTRYQHNFTYATVKGAGHMVPHFRAQASLDMARRFVEKQQLTASAASRLHVLV